MFTLTIKSYKDCLNTFSTTILVINDKVSNKTYEQELTEDLSYLHKRKPNKLKRELESEEQ